MRSPMLKKVSVVRKGKVQEDLVPEEGFYVLKVNNSEINVLISPERVKEFCYGHLLTEGYIMGKDDVESYVSRGKKIEVKIKGYEKRENPGDSDSRNIRPMEVSPRALDRIREAVDEKAVAYNKASATHSAGIFERDGKNIAFAEDIGRHNAVDKVIGHCLLKGISLEDKILFTTGRVSTVLMLKAIRARIPAIASLTAPMSNSVKLAKDSGRTLIGFLKKPGNDCHVYNGRLQSA